MGRAEQQHLDWLARSLGHPDYAPVTGVDIELIRRVGEEVTLAVSAPLFAEGDAPTRVYFVESGAVEIHRGEGTTRRVITRVGSGAMLGDLSAFQDRPYSFSATASGPVRALRFERARLLPELTLHPGLLLRWLVAGQRQVQASHQRVIALVHKTVLSQVADLLVEESARSPVVRLSQATIANLLGVSRQSVNEALARLKEQNLVGTGYRTIRVLDRESLALVASEWKV